jgi:hypothetical protein
MMKRMTIFAALLVLLVTSVAAQRPPTLTDDDIESVKTVKPKAEENAKPTASTPPAKADTNSTWANFSSEAGGFTISMPATATKMEIPFGADNADLFKAFVANQDGRTYIAGYADGFKVLGTNTKITQTVLEQIVDVIAQKFRGKILNQRDITHQSHLGKEFELENPEEKAIVKMRVFAAEKRMFLLVSVVPKSESQSDKVSPFLDSFKIGK